MKTGIVVIDPHDSKLHERANGSSMLFAALRLVRATGRHLLAAVFVARRLDIRL